LGNDEAYIVVNEGASDPFGGSGPPTAWTDDIFLQKFETEP